MIREFFCTSSKLETADDLEGGKKPPIFEIYRYDIYVFVYLKKKQIGCIS